MIDATWYDETAPNETSRNDWIGAWLSRAQAQGVTSKASYLAKPAAQDVAVRRYHNRVAGYISALGLLDYEGQTVNGIVITRSGLLAACHLLGCGTVRDYLESPGGGTPARDGTWRPVAPGEMPALRAVPVRPGQMLRQSPANPPVPRPGSPRAAPPPGQRRLVHRHPGAG